MAILSIAHIPDGHPKRDAIEQAIHDSLRGFTGDWIVRVMPSGDTWSLTLRRVSDNLRRTLVLNVSQQTPETVADELKQALQDVA